jgi:hypothetical protein
VNLLKNQIIEKFKNFEGKDYKAKDSSFLPLGKKQNAQWDQIF